MKKILLILCCVILLSCVNDKTDTNSESEIVSSEEQEKMDFNNAASRNLEGLVESGHNYQLCIIENWESRSRVSYYVYGEHYSELEENIGKIAFVTGKVLESSSPWTKYILVEEIVSIR